MTASDLEQRLKADFPDIDIRVDHDPRFLGVQIYCSYLSMGCVIDIRHFEVDAVPVAYYQGIVERFAQDARENAAPITISFTSVDE